MATMTEQALNLFRVQIGVEEKSESWHTIDQSQIDAFAETTLDRQYIHVDPERAAKESPFGATIAHGFLTLSMISHLVGEIPRPTPDPYRGATTMINYGLDRVRWPTPVKVNSRIRVRRELRSADSKDANSIQLMHLVTVDLEGSEKPACVAEWVTRVLYQLPG